MAPYLGFNPLPKTTQATSITVFDLSQDLAGRNEGACEAYYAMLAIQRLVNRTAMPFVLFARTPSDLTSIPIELMSAVNRRAVN